MKYLFFIGTIFLSLITKAQVYFDTSNYYFYISDTPSTIDSYYGQMPATHYLLIAGPKIKSKPIIQENYQEIDLETHINWNKPIGQNKTRFTNDKAGIIGRRIIETPDSIIILNEHFESFTLKLNAAINQPYKAFKNDTIFVTVKNLEDSEYIFLDTARTTKRFLIQVYLNDSTELRNNPFNKTIIAISQGLGIVASPNLSSFPYIECKPAYLYLAGITSFSKQLNLGFTYYSNPLNWYQNGDEFHIHSSFLGPSTFNGQSAVENNNYWSWRKVISKQLNSTNDSIQYSYEYSNTITEHLMLRYEPNTVIKDTMIKNKGIANYSLPLTYIPKSNPFRYFETEMISLRNDNIFTSMYVLNKPMGITGEFYTGYSIFLADDSVWFLGFSDHTPRTSFYHGIGIPIFSSYTIYEGAIGGAELIYAKKGNKTWGTPLPLNASIEEVQEQVFTIYPNPAQNILYVEGKQPIQSLELYSLEGKQHASCKDCNSIDVNTISSGLYILNIDMKSGTKVQKKVVIQ